MWKKILEANEVLKTNGDPAPKKPENKPSDTFPKNEGQTSSLLIFSNKLSNFE